MGGVIICLVMFCAMVASIVLKMMNMRMSLDVRSVLVNYQITKQVNPGTNVMIMRVTNREKAVLSKNRTK